MYRHTFGQFFDFVRVDGQSYYFEDYKQLSKTERTALREEAVKRCGEANQRKSDAWKKLTAPVDEECRRRIQELEKLPRFQKRYRGRAEDIRCEEKLLRDARNRKLGELQGKLPSVDGCTYPAAVHDVFTVWETMIETDWEKFERLVTNHDWYYHYSDDYSVYAAGNRRMNEIRSLMEKLGDKATALYNEKCPWLNEDGSHAASN